MPAATPLPERQARLFWAAGLDQAAAAFAGGECARLQPLLDSPKIRWQPPANWHLTLAFLGNTGLGSALAMAELLRSEVAVLAPFPVGLGGALWFPSREHPRVIALPVVGSAPLLALASVVAEAARACGQSLEPRPFRGHVSIARVKHGYRPRDPLPDAGSTASLCIDHVALYESVSSADGVRYQVILKLPLRAADR